MVDLSNVTGFEWDGGNDTKNAKHSVTCQQAEEVFSNAPLWIADDVAHSAMEERARAIGMTNGGLVLVVAFTLRAVGTQTAAAAITASVPDGKLATPQERALPWEASFTVPRGTAVLVKVDNNSREGSVKCQILVDDRVVKEVESGPNVISATCLVPAI